MIAFAYYPFYLFRFWYIDVLIGLVNFFGNFNKYLINLLSLNLLIKTFFKPLKNEYRQGLVLFSIIFGIVIKSFLISFLSVIFLVFLIVECLIIVALAVFPIGLVLIILGVDSAVLYE